MNRLKISEETSGVLNLAAFLLFLLTSMILFSALITLFLFRLLVSLPAPTLAGELEESLLTSLHSGNPLVSSNLDTIRPALPSQVHSIFFNYLREANVAQRSDFVKVDAFDVTIPSSFYKTHVLGISSDQSALILPYQSVDYRWEGTVDDIEGHRWAVLRSKSDILVSDGALEVQRLGKVELLADLNVFTKQIIIKSIRRFDPVPLRAEQVFHLSPSLAGFKAKLEEPLYHTAVLGMHPQAKSIILTQSSSPVEMVLVESGIRDGKWMYTVSAPKGRSYLEFLSKNNVDYIYVLPDGQMQNIKGRLVIGGWKRVVNGETWIEIQNLQRAEKN